MTQPPIFPLETAGLALGSQPFAGPLGATFPFAKTRSKSTGIFVSSSGIRTNVIRRIATLWVFEIDFGALSGAAGSATQGIAANSLQTVVGFFEDQVGAYGIFLFLDPTDCTIVNQVIGTGDGATLNFVVTRTLGSTFAEPVGWINVGDIVQVLVNGSPVTGYSITHPNTLVLAEAPGAGQPVEVTASRFYFQCTAPDEVETIETMWPFWTAEKIRFSSIVPNYPSLTLIP
jgi:uncharacterized protein (TIGR02217 family)